MSVAANDVHYRRENAGKRCGTTGSAPDVIPVLTCTVASCDAPATARVQWFAPDGSSRAGGECCAACGDSFLQCFAALQRGGSIPGGWSAVAVAL